MDAKAILEKKHTLRPTATVIRDRRGTVYVEREDLLTEAQRQERVANAVKAGKLRKGLLESLTQQQAHRIFPIESGKVYEYESGPATGDGWKACSVGAGPSSTSLPGVVRVLSFNVWFSEYEWEARLDALVGLFVNEDWAHVICLQEVTSRVLRKLMMYPAVQERFRLASSIVSNCWYGVLMLFDKCLPSPSIEIVELPTQMGRSALVALFAESDRSSRGSTSLAISTVHLESLKSRATRSLQLQVIRQALDKYETAMLVGDMNITATAGPWADKEEHDELLDTNLYGFVDWWAAMHNNEEATFDTGRNLMLAGRARFADCARYDRACLRLTDPSVWKMGVIRIVGDQPMDASSIRKPIFISDHFGLAMELLREGSEESIETY